MKNLKNYSLAKRKTSPTILNSMLEELFKDKTLSREIDETLSIEVYKPVKEEESHIKSLPEIERKEYVKRGAQWYKQFNNISSNNCLDIWEDDTYKSINPDLKHEGLAIFEYAYLREDSETYFIKIEQDYNDEYFSQPISKNEALRLAKKAKNYELLKKIIDEEEYSTNGMTIKRDFYDIGKNGDLEKSNERTQPNKEEISLEIKKLKLKIEELENNIQQCKDL